MGGICVGEHKCASCGVEARADLNYKMVLKTNFINYDELLISGGAWICQSCANILEDPDMRFHPVLFRAFGVKEVPERETILPLLKNPPKQFVLSLPYSFKKHHWLFAGLSTNEVALVGTDSRTVEIDYHKYDVFTIVGEVQRMIGAGIPRHEIINGRYSAFTRARFPGIDKSEAIIGEMRTSGAVELFVKYTPAQKEKIEIREESAMITETEATAAQLLYNISANSQMRVSDGIRFWGGFFERRINRYKQLPLHEFASKLAAAVGSGCNLNAAFVNGIPEEQEEFIMRDIREETNLILALAYEINKGAKKK